ncbi:SUMO-activating enzyme subunit 1 [Schistosoma japonicum]|uniref:SUMO-activating enzyme subunit 1 n=1 Tax=Schistosoma japonicum TaxID=6182 RepID=C1LHM2_SCHJA|nr:SUMO-activating enzyme subunit 1 [Schistosoma japonicum]CAX74200.1 SUMO-activating enzyme subunit 1 [Schistosoma japonicum]
MLSEHVTNNLITEEEAELYDRQIRLWGIESQNRLKQSKILLLGMNALAAEIAKNIVLAGISSLTIIDDQQVTIEDCENNFLIPHDCLGQKRSDAAVSRTQSLNPMVKLQSSEMGDLKEKIQEHNFIILITECSSTHFKQWSTVCDIVSGIDIGTKPYVICASATGLFGFVFIDLNTHECLSENVVLKKRSASTLPPNLLQRLNKTDETSNTETVLVRKTFNYCRLTDSLCLIANNLKNKLHAKYIPKGYFLMQILSSCSTNEAPFTLSYLRSQWQNVSKLLDVDEAILSTEDLECCSGPIVPAVNPVLGGVVSQEIIRAITRKGAPHGNWYFFNGSQCSVTVDWLPPNEKSQISE